MLQKYLLVVATALTFTSCATILGGTKTKIQVETNQQNSVYFNGSKEGEGTTKIKTNGKKLNGSSIVVKDVNGNVITEHSPVRKVKGWMIFLNIVTTGGVGLIVDFVDGAIYKANQKNIVAQ